MKNIIVIGEPGTGKSSVINMVLGRTVAKTSEGAIGCTFDFKSYQSDCKKYCFWDTAGIGEGLSGTVPTSKALSQIIKLIVELHNTGGTNLIIFVIKKGKISSSFHNTFKLFADIIFKNRVPSLLVVTNCEMEDNLQDWIKQQKQEFTEQYKMNFIELIGVCSTNGDDINVFAELKERMKILYSQSFTILITVITKHILAESTSFPNLSNWANETFLSVINFLRTIVFLRKLENVRSLESQLIDSGIEKEEAVELCLLLKNPSKYDEGFTICDNPIVMEMTDNIQTSTKLTRFVEVFREIFRFQK